MCDVLVMKQNLFGAGSIYHVAANRTPIMKIYFPLGNAVIRRAFTDSAWLADGHRAKLGTARQNAIRRSANAFIGKIPIPSE
jgi:hypothetical protein